MRVEIIELLRCPTVHESSPLVTVASVRDGDRLVEGALGCAVCGAEYALTGGVVFLGDERIDAAAHRAVDATRTAALLGLSEPGGRVGLCGAFGTVADAIEASTGATCVTVNAWPDLRSRSPADHLVIDIAASLPLASASLNGLAVDAAHVTLLPDAARVVRRAGRVLAPAHAPLPAGVQELARDDVEWVAVVTDPVSAPVGLRRSRDAAP